MLVEREQTREPVELCVNVQQSEAGSSESFRLQLRVDSATTSLQFVVQLVDSPPARRGCMHTIVMPILPNNSGSERVTQI